MLRPFSFIDKWVEKISSFFLVLSIFLMLLMSVGIIVLRWFDITFLWAEPFIRHMVFLSAFLGGVLATGKRTHIGIDIIGKYFEAREMWKAHKLVAQTIALASSATLFWLMKASIDFVGVEAKYGKVAFLGIHSKFLVAIIPLGCLLIGYRFFYLFLSSFFENEVKIEEGR